MASQKDRTYRLLRERGPLGITPMDFLLPEVVDGGKPILRLPSRIDELRRDHTIKTLPGPNGCAKYVLVDCGTVPQLALDQARPLPGQPAGIRIPQCAIFDDDFEEAA